MKKKLDFKTDFIFPIMARFIGFILIPIGLLLFILKGIGFFILVLAGIGISFTRNGILIDLQKNRIQSYTQVFWVKTGKWKSLSLFPFLTVLTATEKHAMYSNANVEHTHKNLVYRITLLSENHRSKLLLKQLNKEKEAHEKAQKIAEELTIDKVIYSPC